MLPLRIRRSAGLLIITLSMLMALAIAAPAAAKNPPGNNGTVKIHDNFEAEPIVRNEPHVVCDFHLHFFFSDSSQEGDWWIESWPPTGNKTTVMGRAPYGPTNAAGEWATGALTLSAGHYKLYWEGRNDHNIKHKVFWVEPCVTTLAPPPPPPPPTPPTPPTGGGTLPSNPVRSGTAAGSSGPTVVMLPNTAMETSTPLALLAGMVLLGGSATLAVVEVKRERSRRR